MNEFETQNKKPEKDLQREAVAGLASRLNKSEMPRSIEDLQELTSGIETEWQEDGYGNVASFVGQEGDLVMLARKERNQPNGQISQGHPNQLRFLIDDEVIDVSVPPAMQPQRLGVRGELIGIYDASLVSEDNLPEDMRRLVEKFGERLSVTTSSSGQEVATLNGGYYDFRGVAKETERQHDEYTQAEAEAYGIENNAKIAAGLVKKKLFMTAQKHAALQAKAYKGSVQTATASDANKGPGLSRDQWNALHVYMDTKSR